MKRTVNEYSLLKSVGSFYKNLPKSLISPAQLELLEKAADFFPAIIRFALECRLDDQEQVDLQFCLRRDDDDLGAVCKWFQNKSTGDDDYKNVTDFLTAWADESSFYHKYIPEVFLELDVLPSGIKTPLLFFELQPDLSIAERKQVSIALLNELLGEDRPFYHLLEAIIEACPKPAFVAFLGVLFSRDVEVLRVNVKKLSINAVAPFLKKIGYNFTGPELDLFISSAYNYADRVTLCIDIGKGIYPRISFECFWNEPPSIETYWSYFIQTLNENNLYRKDKIDAILNWNQDVFPEHVEEWPEHLWIASLSKPENEFTFLKKWISHLKISYIPGHAIDLKAYLAYESLWTLKETLDSGGLLVEKVELNAPAEINKAITDGVAYLIKNQLPSGWWKDFRLSPGNSDEWVTAYVGYHLSQLNIPQTNEALNRAWKILSTRYRGNEGWGYNALTPADADSTIWTWLFFHSRKFDDTFPNPGFAMIDRYMSADGGVVTYSLKGPLGKKNQDSLNTSVNYWQIPHYCVTAACAIAGRHDAINFLLEQQNLEGFWYSYWWVGSEYVTALSTEALAKVDSTKYSHAIGKSVHWAYKNALLELKNPMPNMFNMALLLRITMCSTPSPQQRELQKELVKRILKAQQPTGSWGSYAELRSPNSDDRNHETAKDILVVKDWNKNFTSVTILDALNKFNQYVSF